ncbi:hypothetical protein QTP70_008055 [Hemibagrus guttatus]|uniref:Alkaline ceramidase n=1 Tax=Hemibagrus guttatus TaxID=175788 RepID=A0AAE0R0M1_9TELE|nr:hypothetical protein QTP70_008055 [Hemibagrus guttatus]
MSSFIFFVVAPIMLYLLHPYAKERNLAVHLVWLMMIFVGLFSMYFHMTLSFMGQMLDELSILWVLAIGYSLWFPRKHFPNFVKDRLITVLDDADDCSVVRKLQELDGWISRGAVTGVQGEEQWGEDATLGGASAGGAAGLGRTSFSRMVMVSTIITTLLSFVKPTANAYALNFFALHILYSMCVELKSCTDQRVLRLARASIGLWVLAIACWISDRFGCSFWQKLNFCYLHGICSANSGYNTHILIVVATAYGSTLIAYLDANLEIPYSHPDLQYWPRDNWALGLPYIVLKTTPKTQKSC